MSTTHAAIGMLAVLPVAVVIDPELGVTALFAAYAGGVFPDLDVVYYHRRALHYPLGYWLLAIPAGVVAAVEPTVATVAIAAFLGAAALHSVTDIFGGGLGLRPWEEYDDRGVYDHRRGRWIAPRRYVRYDGSPEDLLLGTVAAIPTILVFDGPVRTVALAGVVVSAVYTIVRKRIPDVTPERFQ